MDTSANTTALRAALMSVPARLSGRTKDERADIAYRAVEGIDFLEMNDGNRLGYHVYLFLNGDLPTLSEAIYEAKSRTPVPAAELEQIIGARLTEAAGTV